MGLEKWLHCDGVGVLVGGGERRASGVLEWVGS